MATEIKPPIEPLKQTASTQTGRVLAMLKRAGSRGVFNYELTKISLQYTGRIFALRNEGHNILCERQYLKNGRASNTFKYTLISDKS